MEGVERAEAQRYFNTIGMVPLIQKAGRGINSNAVKTDLPSTRVPMESLLGMKNYLCGPGFQLQLLGKYFLIWNLFLELTDYVFTFFRQPIFPWFPHH